MTVVAPSRKRKEGREEAQVAPSPVWRLGSRGRGSPVGFLLAQEAVAARLDGSGGAQRGRDGWGEARVERDGVEGDTVSGGRP